MSYFQDHPGYQTTFNSNTAHNNALQYTREIGDFFANSDQKILEIGSGQGYFAYFCKQRHIKQYTGIDIDDFFFAVNKEIDDEFQFIKIAFQDYLKDILDTYDVIFLSNVFEHLTQEEQNILITLIMQALKPNGVWINYMPNADAIVGATAAMYTDMTHIRIYNTNSFEQVLQQNKIQVQSIVHRNQYIGISKMRRMVHLCIKTLTRIFFMAMGSIFPVVYTGQMISIVRK